MKKIKQEVVTYVTKYESYDGKIFNTEHECRDHEARMNGVRKTCPNCNGKGYLSDGWHDVRNELTCQYEQVEYIHTCDMCNGKGYLDKVEIWK